jgi:hypothetical protein
MDVRLLTEVLLLRAAWRRRDAWSAEAFGATRPSVTAQVVAAIPRTALGKAPLVVAVRSAPTPPG